MLVHGSGGNSSGPLVQTIRSTVVKANIDVNIIGVEWRRFQLRNINTNIYNCAKLFGAVVGKFVKTMAKDYGLEYANLSMVGHSIAGTFCNEVGSEVNGQIQSIVGLETCSYKDRAKFVEVRK